MESSMCSSDRTKSRRETSRQGESGSARGTATCQSSRRRSHTGRQTTESKAHRLSRTSLQSSGNSDRRTSVASDNSHRSRTHRERIGERCDRSEEHTSELQSLAYIVCRLLLENNNPWN